MEYIFPTILMNPQDQHGIEAETYLDIPIVHSRKRIYYPSHIQIVFERGKLLLWFIVPVVEISVDHLMVEVIL